MTLAWLLLITGLTISAVAIYYSVIGLAAIFAAAVIPIYIMGSSLEVAKLVCAVWLKANWRCIPTLMRIYMTTAVVVLMFITSMGIFGFLSQAHSDQTLMSGDVQSRISLYDEQIKTERENIEAARTALAQMDAQVNERLARSDDDRGAERAVQIRRQQRVERDSLQKDIAAAQTTISRLNQERAPIAAEIRKVEAEVGPIKYIAKLIYGDNTDTNLLEKAVTWVIILIVAVFDPLAVIMLLAAQMSFQWARDQKTLPIESAPTLVVTALPPEPDLSEEANAKIAEIEKTDPEFNYPKPVQSIVVDSVIEKSKVDPHPVGWMYTVSVQQNIQTDADVATSESVSEAARPGDYLIMPELSEESKKKTYMIKQSGQQIVKTKE